jgi:hypothetical protein
MHLVKALAALRYSPRVGFSGDVRVTAKLVRKSSFYLVLTFILVRLVQSLPQDLHFQFEAQSSTGGRTVIKFDSSAVDQPPAFAVSKLHRSARAAMKRL